MRQRSNTGLGFHCHGHVHRRQDRLQHPRLRQLGHLPRCRVGRNCLQGDLRHGLGARCRKRYRYLYQSILRQVSLSIEFVAGVSLNWIVKWYFLLLKEEVLENDIGLRVRGKIIVVCKCFKTEISSKNVEIRENFRWLYQTNRSVSNVKRINKRIKKIRNWIETELICLCLFGDVYV